MSGILEGLLKIAPLVSIVTAIVVAFFGLPKAFHDFSGITRRGAEFEELKKLEAYLDGGDKTALELQRQYLIHKTRENLTHRIYVRRGMDEQGIRKIGLGYISYCLWGFEIGIDVALTLLILAASQKDENGTESIKLFSCFFAFLLITGITYYSGTWIRARIMLDRQFHRDMKPLCNTEINDGLQTIMDRSFNDLIDGESNNIRRKICNFFFASEWFLFVVATLVYGFFDRLVPIKKILFFPYIIHRFNLNKQGVYVFIESAVTGVDTFVVYAFLITVLVAAWPFPETQEFLNHVKSLPSRTRMMIQKTCGAIKSLPSLARERISGLFGKDE